MFTGKLNNKKITLNIVVLILVALTALLIGSMLGKSPREIANIYQHKYDSVSQIITHYNMTLQENQKGKDSARIAISKLKYEVIELNHTINVRNAAYERERINHREKLREMTSDELSREARLAYIRAHPTPLFDTTFLGEPVAVERYPVIHLLEQDKKAIHLEKENTDLKELDTVRGKEVLNLLYQLTKYQSDSVALQSIVDAQEVALETKDKELADNKKAYKQELRRQKVQKILSITLAVLSTIAAIVF